jgi:hypothetical protein
MDLSELRITPANVRASGRHDLSPVSGTSAEGDKPNGNQGQTNPGDLH